MTLKLTSPVFADGDAIPSLYTCDSEGRSLPMAWSGAPAGTKSFALICDDPDAPGGTFSHWAIWNIPGEHGALYESLPIDAQLDEGLCQGTNDFGQTGYGPPCPPQGHGAHRYIFRLYALDRPRLDVAPAAKVPDVEQAAKPHALETANLTGTYER